MLNFVDILSSVSTFLSEMWLSTKTPHLQAPAFESLRYIVYVFNIRTSQLDLFIAVSSHLTIEFSKFLSCELIDNISSSNGGKSSSALQIRLLTLLIAILPPIETWISLDHLLKFEILLRSSIFNVKHGTMLNQHYISLLGELYLCSPFLLSRTGSIFLQLLENSNAVTSNVKSIWRSRFRDAIHPRRQSLFSSRFACHPRTTANDHSTTNHFLDMKTPNTTSLITTCDILPNDGQISPTTDDTIKHQDNQPFVASSLLLDITSQPSALGSETAKDSISEASDPEYSLVTDLI